MHKKIKNFHCNFCEKKYAWKQSLDSHIRLVHDIEKSKAIKQQNIKLEVGEINSEIRNTLGLSQEMESHIEKHEKFASKSRYQCLVCKEVLENPLDLIEHVENTHKNDLQNEDQSSTNRIYRL